MHRSLSRVTALAFLMIAMTLQQPAGAISTTIVISQVYGGGGNSGASYTHDFVELFNRGTSTVSLEGWSIQYTSATGTGTFGSAASLITPLSGSLAPGQYLLVQEAPNAAVGAPLPTPDVTDLSPISMAAGAGKVALVNTTTPLGCNGGSTPCSSAALATVVDLVGYGTGTSGANFFEGAGPAPTLSATLAAFRGTAGCADTDNNAADFAAATPAPRNSASALNVCAPPPPTINEFSASTAGTDVEYVEIHGAANTDYSSYRVLEIEGDAGTAAGTIDDVIALGTTDANGLHLISLPANALENGTITLLLVKNFTGALNADLDTNDDGVFDVTPWDAVVDGVAVNDGGAGDLAYAVPTLGVAYDGATFAPGGASRIPDGTDTDTTADWVRNDFDLAGIPGFAGTLVAGEALNTPGAANQAFTVTSSIISIEATDGDAAEGGSNVASLRISRTGSVAAGLTVNYSLGGTASAADYTPVLGGTVEIPAGVAFVDAVITPVDDLDQEEAETLTVTLTSGIGYLLGATTSASVTIADNDAPIVLTGISAIQGSGPAAAAGTFTIEAIVVGDYQAQGSGRLRGFFVQEEDSDADADPATSEGLFVFCTTCPVAVNVGDKVRVTGTSSEFFDMSQLTASTLGSVSVITTGNTLPTPATVQLPVPRVPGGNVALATDAINAYFEAFEGMLVTFPGTLSVSEYFELARYGQVILSEGGRPHSFTAVNTPTTDGLIDHEIDLARRTIILDDTDNRENRPSDAPNTAYFHPVPGLSTSHYFRGGDTIANLTGVLHWSFAGGSSPNAWRIRPVTERYSYSFTPVNVRAAVPEVAGGLRVASFNVLNFFLTIDTSNVCSPTQDQDCRGADSEQELQRQRAKLLAALSAIDADVFGFMEMENTTGVEPLADIVAGLPGYSYIDTGVVGTDAIRVGIIYKTSAVMPSGSHAILDSSVDPRFIDTRNRPALAQTFEELATGERFTLVVNHLKSKGSGCGAGDDDTTTGQGNCNGTRTLAAQALADWLAGDPTESGDPDVLIIGDMNSYAKEDPIVTLRNAGYTDLVGAFGGPSAYGYVFDGQLGYLDHALANASLTPQVAGVAEWHINADEVPLFDYNDDVRSADEAAFEEESDTLPLYEPNAFRTSDHDPVIIGLALAHPNDPPTVDGGGPYEVFEGATVDISATGSDPNAGDTLTYAWDLDNDGTFETAAATATFSAAALGGPSSFTVNVRVTDDGGMSATDTTTIEIVNLAPLAAGDSASVEEDHILTVAAPGVLSNDQDVPADTLTAVVVSAPLHGAVTLNPNGSFTYTPSANYNGADEFTYRADDGTADGAVATVSLTVSPVNDAPVARPDAATVAKNGTVTILALRNDDDLDGDALTVANFTQPGHGTVAFSQKNTNFRYTPAKGFRGTDVFTYTIIDGHGGTAVATVTITVQ